MTESVSELFPQKKKPPFLSPGLCQFIPVEDTPDAVPDVSRQEFTDLPPNRGQIGSSLRAYSRAIYLHCCAARGHGGV